MLSFEDVTGFSFQAGVLALCLCVACKADKIEPNAPSEDAGVDEILEAPLLNAVPVSTPNQTVAIRGTSTGKRVVVQGGTDGTSITSILPGGSFCGEVGLKTGEPTILTVYAMGDGLISAPTEVIVNRDATAPVPPSPTCSGSSPVNCEVPEVCSNETDDNCDGWIDGCDLDCSQCVDDSFEPNDFAVNVPLIAKGTYSMTICPCRDDWFAFERNAGQRIKVTADFVHATLPINMRLYKASPAGEQGDLVVGSFSSTDQEIIDELVDESTLYFLRIYAFGGTDPSGPYQLKIE